MNKVRSAHLYFQVRNNIKVSLACRLKDIASDFRRSEKEHFLKVKELHGEEFGSGTKEEINNFLDDTQEFDDHQLIRQKEMSKEVDQLVNTINDLAVLFKELSILTVEQGTILDRIDFNVAKSHEDVKQGNVELEKTRKIEKSMRSKAVLLCLLATIIVLGVILVIKHS